MRVGRQLLDLARAADARTIFVVGTGRNVGKTTTLRAMYAAACDAGARVGLASLNPKHRLWLEPRTLFVTARSALARTPAAEVLDFSGLQSPAGPLLFVRTVAAGLFELVGPSTASGVGDIVETLASRSDTVIVDGAVDRVAAFAGAQGAILVACGAAAAKTMQEAVDEVAALVARLSVPRFDGAAPSIEIDGALTPSATAAFLAARETRQIVVRDPTQVVLSGKAVTHALARLRIRCRRPLRVIAITVTALAPERAFEPRAFAQAVAGACGVPAFDVYAGTHAA
jgi:Domain of unknown function (DUF1611_C) P-loop domain